MAPIPARKPIERPMTLEAASIKSSRDPRRRPSCTPSVEPERIDPPQSRAPSRAEHATAPTEAEHASREPLPGEWVPFPDLSLEQLLDAREDLYEAINSKSITDDQESIETKCHGSVLTHEKLPDGTRLPLHYILNVLIEKRKAPTVPEAVMNDAEDNTTAEEQSKAKERMEKPPPSPRTNPGPPHRRPHEPHNPHMVNPRSRNQFLLE
ncbi:hypothetical protein FRB99_004192 [Tulasnella sp. 403]|nr:hypothetical protein FRB99_004192 [Tulasnella sp. 403]